MSSGLALYIDENVERAITDGLTACNLDVLTVQQDGRDGARDSDVLNRAIELGRIVFTRDADFLAEAQMRQASGKSFPGIIYSHKLKLSIGECIRQIELIARVLNADEMANRVQFLPIT